MSNDFFVFQMFSVRPFMKLSRMNFQRQGHQNHSTFIEKFKQNQLPLWAGLSVIGLFHYRRLRQKHEEEINDGLNPVDCLEELADTQHLPKAYHNGLIDPDGMRKQFVLLHDEVDGPKDFKVIK